MQPTMNQDPPQEQEVVRGTVVSVITKGPDKWQIAVQPEGSQYTKNIWTKEQPLVNDMSQRIGQAFDFLCNASHWTNQSGQPVRSLWFESIAAYGTLAAPQPVVSPQQGMQQVQPQQQMPQGTTFAQPQPAATQMPMGAQALPQEVKEQRIMRQTAMKVAAQLLPYLPKEQQNLSGLQLIAEWQVRYYVSGPQSDPLGQQAPPQPQETTVDYWGNPVGGDPGPQEGQYESYEGGFPG
jgi:hypothetical protein